MNLIQITWPDPVSPGSIAGTRILPAVLPVETLSVVEFTTPEIIGAKSGSLSLFADQNAGAGSYGGNWPWQWALSTEAGDLVGLVNGNGMQPLAQWRGVPSPEHGQPMPQLLPLTKYFFNLMPYEGTPNECTGFGVRFQLSAGRLA